MTTEYVVLSADDAATLTRQISRYASAGWVVSEFSIARAGNYGSYCFLAAVMEREKS